jgi:hypothetical protein
VTVSVVEVMAKQMVQTVIPNLMQVHLHFSYILCLLILMLDIDEDDENLMS